MALLDTFRGILETKEQADKRVNAALQDLFRSFIERADHLEQTAEMAPSEAMDRDLRKLAADHRATADIVRDVLESRKSSAPATPVPARESSGGNHWARIVENLDEFHQGRDRLMQLSNDILESYPELTPPFDTLTQRMADHIARLRGEIARADPQALN